MQSCGIVRSVTKATVMAMSPTGITVLQEYAELYGIVRSVTKATVMAMLPTGITVLQEYAELWDSAKCDKSYGHGYVTDRFIVV